MDKTENRKIIFFDGYCNLCNGAVIFIIKREKGDHFRFAPLQDPVKDKILMNHNIQEVKESSIALIKNRKVYYKSDAALIICLYLKGLWPLCFAFKIIPRFFRDAVYDFIANHRYQWFGKKDKCMVPDEAVKGKFLAMD